MDLKIIIEPATRAVSLPNESWLVLLQCVESFSSAYRAKHSQVIATYVTRGQLEEAVAEAKKMNIMLQELDKLQAKLV